MMKRYKAFKGKHQKKQKACKMPAKRKRGAE